MNELIEIKSINPVDLFTNNGLGDVLNKIKIEAGTLVSDVGTDKGRREIKSLARKIASSKVAIDNAGKELVQEWKEKSKLVDVSRKESRDFLDALRDEVRMPVTKYEQEKAEKEAAQKLNDEINASHDEAIILDNQYNKLLEIKAREEALILREKQERDRIEKEQAEAKKLSDIETIKKKAKADAERAVEEEAQAKVDAAIKAEAIAKYAEEQAELRIVEQKKLMEAEKKQAIIDAENKIKREALEAENKRIAEDQERLSIEAENKKLAKLESQNKEHRRAINTSILDAFITNGVDEAQAKDIIKLIAKNKIPNILINY